MKTQGRKQSTNIVDKRNDPAAKVFGQKGHSFMQPFSTEVQDKFNGKVQTYIESTPKGKSKPKTPTGKITNKAGTIKGKNSKKVAPTPKTRGKK